MFLASTFFPIQHPILLPSPLPDRLGGREGRLQHGPTGAATVGTPKGGHQRKGLDGIWMAFWVPIHDVNIWSIYGQYMVNMVNVIVD